MTEPRLATSLLTMQANSLTNYQKTVFQPVNMKRKEHIDSLKNQSNYLFFEKKRPEMSQGLGPKLVEIKKQKSEYAGRELSVMEDELKMSIPFE